VGIVGGGIAFIDGEGLPEVNVLSDHNAVRRVCFREKGGDGGFYRVVVRIGGIYKDAQDEDGGEMGKVIATPKSGSGHGNINGNIMHRYQPPVQDNNSICRSGNDEGDEEGRVAELHD
jgi:hypothetical protein